LQVFRGSVLFGDWLKGPGTSVRTDRFPGSVA
jgi:hypothetical protein